MPRDFHSKEGVEEWLDSLDERWPQRAEIAIHIGEKIAALPFERPALLELCCGGGRLAEQVLGAVPTARYSGLDFSSPLLERAGVRLTLHKRRVSLLQVDLNEDEWITQLKTPVEAIFSLQSLHDLGDESRVERIYQLCRPLLAAGGLFINADFQHDPGDPRPGRLSIERHLQLLKKHGYQNVECTLVADRFAVCCGRA